MGDLPDGWFDLSAKVRIEAGRLMVLDLELGATDRPPTGIPSARALKGGTDLIWRHKVEF